MEQSELLAVIERAGQDGSPELDLGNQGIDYLPPEIGNLSQLSELSLVDNSLTTLPVEIGNLRNLTGLHLSHNRYLDVLPREVFNLTSLRELSLPGHDTAVPPEISNLANLEELYIGHGPLKTLPPEIWDLPYLSALNVCATFLEKLCSRLQLQWLAMCP